ncbi:DMT family transporter [Conchiformibius kuhniae]|uniref:DMT family transporter n=1 Tax=Conchiformibius kuhniae TaxID=211502 RepID=A0A8T9MY00_9NEIS|nr:DMT family transporter [Conchiformibius kuhniae]UOP05745.1 DMT family transporter [Conchiformibius kuhniae]
MNQNPLLSPTAKGLLFAAGAAALNASIGIFSKILLAQGLNAQDIAFLKTAAAGVFLGALFVHKPFSRRQAPLCGRDKPRRMLWAQVALCAFLGIFTLFYFETAAYAHGHAANVVVVLMASAAVSALLFGRLWLGERITAAALAGTGAAVVGIALISWTGGGSAALSANAAVAGTGYGAFSVLVKKFGLNGGLRLTCAVMLLGALFLLPPFVQTMHPIHWNTNIIAALLGLALLPTILGFYCTTKALNCMSAAKVQVAELSEPLFAAAFAWLLLHETPNGGFWAGAAAIVSGIALMNGIFQGKKA